MKTCDDCPNPAQWMMLWVQRFPHTEEEKAQKLAPKGPVFTVAGRFCGAHKERAEAIPVPAGMERVFRFSGLVVG